jgi:malic enzyme
VTAARAANAPARSRPAAPPSPAARSPAHPAPGRLPGPIHAAAATATTTTATTTTTTAASLRSRFGRDYIIPKPFDERLLPEVAAAVVRAAIETGVARLADIDVTEYKRGLVDLSHKLSL